METAYYKIMKDDTIDISTTAKNEYIEYYLNNEPDEVKNRIYDIVQIRKVHGEIYSLNNVDYKVSFTKNDADGVAQVTLGFMQNAFSETIIVFSNGVKLPIKVAEFNKFAIWFAEKRNSFFV